MKSLTPVQKVAAGSLINTLAIGTYMIAVYYASQPVLMFVGVVLLSIGSALLWDAFREGKK